MLPDQLADQCMNEGLCGRAYPNKIDYDCFSLLECWRKDFYPELSRDILILGELTDKGEEEHLSHMNLGLRYLDFLRSLTVLRYVSLIKSKSIENSLVESKERSIPTIVPFQRG